MATRSADGTGSDIRATATTTSHEAKLLVPIEASPVKGAEVLAVDPLEQRRRRTRKVCRPGGARIRRSHEQGATRDIRGGRAARRIEPIKDDQPSLGEDHVRRMDVTVAQGLPGPLARQEGLDRPAMVGRDLHGLVDLAAQSAGQIRQAFHGRRVKLRLQIDDGLDAVCDLGWSNLHPLPHGFAIDSLEHDPGPSSDLNDTVHGRHGQAGGMHTPDDVSLHGRPVTWDVRMQHLDHGGGRPGPDVRGVAPRDGCAWWQWLVRHGP